MIKFSSGLAIAFISISVLNTLPTRAEIFKYTDENGKTVFSDRPPAESQPDSVVQVELGPTNLSAPPPNIPPPVNAVEASSTEAAVPYQTTITSPSEGTTVPMGPGNFVVTALFSPPLGAGEAALLKLDGKAVGTPQKRSSWQLNNVFRGEHQITIERQNAEENVLNTSPPVTVYVLRPSIR